mgnify:CR=1 FL=1
MNNDYLKEQLSKFNENTTIKVMNVNLIKAFKNKEERNCKREWKYLGEKWVNILKT